MKYQSYLLRRFCLPLRASFLLLRSSVGTVYSAASGTEKAFDLWPSELQSKGNNSRNEFMNSKIKHPCSSHNDDYSVVTATDLAAATITTTQVKVHYLFLSYLLFQLQHLYTYKVFKAIKETALLSKS